MERKNLGSVPLQGKRPLEPDDLEVYELVYSDESSFTFCLDVVAEECDVFGRRLSCDEKGSYVQAYAVYEESTGRVLEMMDIVLRLPHDEKEFCCELPPGVRNALKQKMNDYCLGRFGELLPEPVARPKPAKK